MKSNAGMRRNVWIGMRNQETSGSEESRMKEQTSCQETRYPTARYRTIVIQLLLIVSIQSAPIITRNGPSLLTFSILNVIQRVAIGKARDEPHGRCRRQDVRFATTTMGEGSFHKLVVSSVSRSRIVMDAPSQPGEESRVES